MRPTVSFFSDWTMLVDQPRFASWQRVQMMTLEKTGEKTATGLRNLLILEALAQQSRPITATDLNASLNLPKPTIHRLVATLEDEGFLIRHIDGRSYVPGPKLRQMMLGVMRAGQHSLPQREVLLRLNEQVKETCNLSIPDGDAMVYIDRVETQWPLRIQLQVGSRVPLHATSAGKICLANMDLDLIERFLNTARLQAFTPNTITDPVQLRDELARIRERQFATDEEEFVDGMIALAVPVKSVSDQIVATVSFHAPRQRMTLEEGLTHMDKLRCAADDLALLIG